MDRSVIWIVASITLFNALGVHSTLPVPVLQFAERIIEDEDTTIICTLPYDDIPNVKLHIKGNVTFDKCEQFYNKENHTSIKCTLEVTREMHETEFTCEAEFKSEAHQTMHIQTEPEFTDCPNNLVWIEGQNNSFHCKATGYPLPEVTCTKNNNCYMDGEKFTAMRNMSGNYTCRARNFDTAIQNVMVTVEHKPKISTITVHPPLHNEGDAVMLTCNGDGLPDPTYSWSIPPSNVQLSADNRTVTVQKLTYGHLGHYTCTAQNQHGMDTLTQTLDLAAKPKISIFEILPSTQVLEGENVTLSCEASGFPPPVLSWDTPTPGLELSPDNSTLRIWAVKKMHMGKYQCQAQNKHGADTQSKQLTQAVKAKVVKIKVQPSTSVEEGVNVTLTCVAEGVPPPTYSWTIPPTSNVQYSRDNSVINIWRVEKGHGGNYQCKAENKYGEETRTEKISVKVTESKGNSRGQREEPVTATILAMLITTSLLYYFC